MQVNAAYMISMDEQLGGVHQTEAMVALLQQAARQGSPFAISRLGDVHYYGKGVQRNYTEAARYYELAGQLLHKEALYNLGHMYEMGLGVEKNVSHALSLYERSGTPTLIVKGKMLLARAAGWFGFT